MKKKDPILTRDQWIGAAMLCLMVGIVATIVHVVPQPSVVANQLLADSLRLADSLEWEMRRELRRDSLRAVWHVRDSLRRDSLHVVWAEQSARRKDSLHAVWHRRDSLRKDSLHAAWHLRDSLRRDSLHRTYRYVPKKDTILNLNTADTTELMCLPGIGSTTARRVVAFRSQLGGFYAVDQLDGIVPDSVWRHFVVDRSAIRPIKVNSCSLNELNRHPYLRFNQAKALYDYRRRCVRLGGIDDLKKLDCWEENDLNRLKFYLSFE